VPGPTLFIIYVYDLPDCIQPLGIFADDNKLYCPISLPQDHSILQALSCNGVAHGYPFSTFLNVIIAPSVTLLSTPGIFSLCEWGEFEHYLNFYRGKGFGHCD